MSRTSIFSGPGSPTAETATYINTSYDNVKVVSDNIEDVLIVATAITNGDLDSVFDNIDSVILVAADITSVVAVADELPELLAVSGALPELQIIYDNMDALLLVYANLTMLQVIADNMELLEEVAANIPYSLKYLGAHIDPPTARLDGSDLEDGDYYFDSDASALVYYQLSDDSWFHVDPGEVLLARDETIALRDETIGLRDTTEGLKDTTEVLKDDASDYADKAEEEADRAESAASILVLASHAMTKAEFFANAEQRKRDNAGSGFLECGKHRSGRVPINQGLYNSSVPTLANSLYLGNGNLSEDTSSLSRTEYPLAVVDGVMHRIDQVAHTGLDYQRNVIKFPDAEQGTRSYDTATGEVIDYLTDVDPKYGDVASDLNEAVARNFEGSVKNGDFRFGDDGNWNVNENASISTDGILLYAVDDSVFSYATQTIVNSETEVEYEIEFYADVRLGAFSLAYRDNTTVYIAQDVTESGTHKYRFTIDAANPNAYIRFSRQTGYDTYDMSFTNISMRKVTNQPILSRQDYCFLETFHEVISDKGVVFPLGNVQYGANAYEGIPLQATNTLQGYSAFGEWDSETVGYSAVWANLTAEHQKVFLDDPDNNLYFDAGANELIQVRYRVRVIEGVGDNWENVSQGRYTGDGYMAYKTGFSYPNLVNPQGQQDITGGLGLSAGGVFDSIHTAQAHTQSPLIDGGYAIRNTSIPVGHNQLCFALPLCLVQRGNQGAYHPVYNSDGCAKFRSSTLVSQNNWYDNNAYQPTSKGECFNRGPSGFPVAIDTGYIGQPTGRSDQYEFYDAIYAGQVQDLCLNANKQDANRLLEDSIRKAVAGETRGVGKVPFSTVYDDAGSGGSSSADLLWAMNVNSDYLTMYADFSTKNVVSGDWCILYDATLEFALRMRMDVIGSTGDTIRRTNMTGTQGLDWEVLFGTFDITEATNGTGNEVYYILEKELTPEYDSLPWVDIIGSPENILATFPNGVIGQWIPQLPDGTSQKYSLNKKLASGNLVRIKKDSLDDTWDYLVVTFNESMNTTVVTSASDSIVLLHYETLSDFTEPDFNGVVYGDLGDVFAAQDYRVDVGSRLNSSLLNTVIVGDVRRFRTVSLLGSALESQAGHVHKGKLIMSAAYAPEHAPLEHLEPPVDGNTAFKSLYGLTVKDGLIYPIYWGRQLVYTIDNWGDDNTVPVNHSDYTMTDLNGVTVKAFCHIGKNPIGIADYTQTN
ncbi:coil containing protein [Vibrio phage 1.097.O._10N.286.49.B3]|uniref:Coil containing protein n=1 Tax=Vibrio phage 1.097.O._10N.286.49.B3 TaxID=1881383 RepID=A0A2I7R0J0_9CAUD|nr:coil containing protein [Vibrio phage 1.097.O._10N.286.49.B3]AUR87158.1 coil containing protein [Vibrio phage 1.097.O._10N.286.49.B3]